MSRPNQSPERRAQLIPIVARTFSEFGFRRTTTALLAERCGVRQNILYRLWPDKRAMFIAAIEHVYETSRRIWEGLLEASRGDATPAERLLDHEASHLGEFGLYRIIFAGLNETDDPAIRAALGEMYRRFHRFIQERIVEHRACRGGGSAPAPPLAAWAVLGLGTIASIGRELGLLSDRRRRRLIGEVGRLALAGV